jgi:pyrroloquinoline-quinone synthase
MKAEEFWQQIERELAKYDLLQHPFYQAWSAGELSTEDLKFYAEQYYHHVAAFPAYLTALHSRLPEGSMRRQVLANAFDEECGGIAFDAASGGTNRPEYACSHAELWSRFAEGMGSDATKVAEAEPLVEVRDLVGTFREMSQGAPLAEALGALYAYESQVPRIAAEKSKGLKQCYGASDQTCGYFTLHETADIHHSDVWRSMISELVEQDETHAPEALAGASRAALALWKALDGIERQRCSERLKAF